MKETEQTAKESRLQEDRRRYEYMIAWRDRCIQRLQEVLEGLEEEREMLCALFAVTLHALHDKGEGIHTEATEQTQVVTISKEALRQALGRWQLSEMRSEEDGYALTFTPREDEEASEHGDLEKA